MTDMNNQMQILRNQISLLDQRSYVRTQNLSSMRGQLPLVPLPRLSDGRYPQNFPEKRKDGLKMSRANVDSLLHFYNLPTNRTLSEKRERFMEYIGVPIN